MGEYNKFGNLIQILIFVRSSTEHFFNAKELDLFKSSIILGLIPLVEIVKISFLEYIASSSLEKIYLKP